MKKTLSVILSVLLIFSAFSCAALAADNYTDAFIIELEESSADRMAIIPVLLTTDGKIILDHFGSYIVDNNVSRQLAKPENLTTDEKGNPVFDFNALYKSLDDSEKEQFLKDNAGFSTFVITEPGVMIFYKNDLDVDGALLMLETDSPLVPTSCYARDGRDFVFALAAVGSYRFDQTTCIKTFPAGYETQILQGEILGETLDPDADMLYTIPAVSCDTVIQAYNIQPDSISNVKDFLMNMGKFFRDLIIWFFGLFVKI